MDTGAGFQGPRKFQLNTGNITQEGNINKEGNGRKKIVCNLCVNNVHGSLMDTQPTDMHLYECVARNTFCF